MGLFSINTIALFKAIGLLAAALWIYWPNIKGGMCGDDGAVLNAFYVRSGSLRRLKQERVFHNPLRLIPTVIWTVLTGLCPPQKSTVHFHWLNIACHFTTGLLIWDLLNKLGLGSNAYLGALFFVCSPLAVNAVANISGLPSILSGLVASIILLYIMQGHIYLAILLMVGSLLIKQDLVLLPLMAGSLMLCRGQWTGLGLILLPLLLLCIFRKKALRNIPVISPDHGWPPLMSPVAYAKSFIVETITRMPKWFLGFGYSISPSVKEASWTQVVLKLVCLALLTVTLCWWSPMAMLGLLLILTSPWMGYVFKVMPDLILEHRAYVSLVGMSLIASAIMGHLPTLLIGVWIGVLASIARSRSRAWQPGRLWHQAIEDGTAKPMPLLNLSSELLQQGRVQEASQLIEQALVEAPNAFHAHANIANIYAMTGQMHNAINKAKWCAFRYPRVPQAATLCANFYERVGHTARALALYKKALRISPQNQDILDMFARCKHAHSGIMGTGGENAGKL